MRSFFSLSGLSMLLSLLGGCGHEEPEEKFPGIVRVSQNGSNLYFQAKQQYGKVRALDLHGPPLAKAMDGVMTLLDGAATNDPKCPLFYGKRGELLIELGPDSYNRARTELNYAITLSEDWVPSWIALAELESRANQPQRAMQWLVGADKAIDSLEQSQKKRPTPQFSILGLGVQSQEQQHDPRDPSLEDTERRQLLLNWLQESEQWSLESPGLLTQIGSNAFTVNRTNLFRRLRARTEFERILVRLRAGETPTAVMAMFDRVFEWDPDLFPARIEKASQLKRMKEYRQAERLLRPYLESTDPKLNNNSRLLYEMASIYTEWYIQDSRSADAESISKLAEQAFTRLHERNPNHANGWIERARLYCAAGTQAKNPKTLKDARQWLDNAKEVLGKETPEIKQVAQQIDRAEKLIGGHT